MTPHVVRKNCQNLIIKKKKKAIESSGTVINNNYYSLAYQAREQELVLL